MTAFQLPGNKGCAAAAFCLAVLLFVPNIFSREISKSFELRYVSADAKANGETDFKGETAVFDTGQRVAYLSDLAAHGKRFFNDPGLDSKTVLDAEVRAALEKLKPQPLPEVRREIPISNWKYLGYRAGQRDEQSKRLAGWNSMPGAEVRDGVLVIDDSAVRLPFAPLSWRAHFEWKACVPTDGAGADFGISNAVSFGFEKDGTLYYIAGDEKMRGRKYEPGSWHHFKVELDLESGNGRYNLYVDGEKAADFVPISSEAEKSLSNPSSPFGKNDSYLVFVGKGQYMDMGTAGLSPRQGTIEFCFNLREKGRGGDDAPFLFSHLAPRNQWSNRIYMRHGEGDGFSVRLGDSELVKGIFHPEVGQWHHVALTWQEGKYAVYVDGEIKKEGSYDGLEEVADVATLGNLAHPDRRTYAPRAYIDELRIWNHARDGARIREYADKRLSGNQEGLVGYWPLNAGEGAVVEDASGNGNTGQINKPADGETRVIVDAFRAGTDGTLKIDDLCITSFGQKNEGSRDHPYDIEILLNQDFELPPDPGGFEKADYDDSQWATVPYRRYAHGGERNAGEYLYLRKWVQVGDFKRAELDCETVRPAGVLYVNGKKIANLGRTPARVDLSDALRPNQPNLIALRVDPYDVGDPRWHMSVDTHSSWFAGLMSLELTDWHFIDDVFAYATALGDPANLRVEVDVDAKEQGRFEGQLVVEATPWYPVEAGQPSAIASTPILIDGSTSKTIDLPIPDPDLWTTETPNLYKVRVVLKDRAGNAVDDKVLTTGLRTVSQEGGTFRVNGEPSMLNGPLIFGHHAPIERIAQWMYSPPKRKWIEYILATRKMNGNTFRMSIHDKRVCGSQDRRLAQIADQLGMMLIWQSPLWVREGRVEENNFDVAELARYAKAVRNHPSIVMWQPANHPNSFEGSWYGKVLEVLSDLDPSRLIAPVADTHKGKPTEWPKDDSDLIPGWTHPQVARGNMEQTTAFGKNWSVIRELGTGVEKNVADCNDMYRVEYLNSDTHAWFDFENEETIGQLNWSLHRGQPYYRMYSYEKSYDTGSIGRVLSLDEWEESQAWQALSISEAYRKKRWLGYDGLNWCCLHGGPNTATYKKPIVDYLDYAKLGYHAMRMAFQPVLAGSKNVDIVYGPEDEIPVMVLNIGDAKTVDVKVVAKDMQGRIADSIDYESVNLPAGRTVTDLPPWRPDLKAGQSYAFEYSVNCDEE